MNAYWEGSERLKWLPPSFLSRSPVCTASPGLKLGLRVYGHQTKFIQGEQDCDDTELVVPLAEGNNLLIQKALGRIRPAAQRRLRRSLNAQRRISRLRMRGR